MFVNTSYDCALVNNMCFLLKDNFADPDFS